MLTQIIKFELKYRAKRPATYLYFLLLFLLAFGLTSTDVIEIFVDGSQLKVNAPAIIGKMMVTLFMLAIPVCASIMGVAVVRDFEHKMESLLFTTSISKFNYLFGRFSGSFIVLLSVVSAIVAGMIAGYHMPWIDSERLVSFNFWHYVQPFLLFCVPTAFICSTIFFAGGALSRKMLVVYTQGIIFLALYITSISFMGNLEHKELAGILDIFGVRTLHQATRYWTPAQVNTSTIPLEGILLYNKVIWVAMGFLTIVICYFKFKFNVVQNSFFNKKRQGKSILAGKIGDSLRIPLFKGQTDPVSGLKKIFDMGYFYFNSVIKEVPFLAIVLSAIIMLVMVIIVGNKIYGTALYPTTYSVLESLGSTTFFLLIIVIYYSGELLWKERDIKMNLVHDALPITDFSLILGKLLGMTFIYIFLLSMLMLSGILIQTIKGFYDYQLFQYFISLFGDKLSYLLLFTLLSFFIHSLVNNKFIGQAVLISIVVLFEVIGSLGVEHELLIFGGNNLSLYSDMNGYGHSLEPYTWFRIYWLIFGFMLFIVATLFVQRGIERDFKIRIAIAKKRFDKPVLSAIVSCIVLFLMVGGYIFYNTKILNDYKNSDTRLAEQALYEKELKKYEHIPQPKIQTVNLKVDLYPSNRSFRAKGQYQLINKTSEAIKEIHVNLISDMNIHYPSIGFDRTHKLKNDYKELGYKIYEMEKAVRPKDSLILEFEMVYESNGFVTGRSNTDIVSNGTFFNNTYFPSLGYDQDVEINGSKDRKEHGLLQKDRLPSIDDKQAAQINLFGDDADKINFEIILGTEKDQIAIAPGTLKEEWAEGERKYFHYKMDQPMVNFYSIVSARYAVKKDSWNGVDLEIFHHPSHYQNLDRMMKGMKDALAYYSENFGPYPHTQLRIMEFPRYQSFAQSFANTIPFSESMGFGLDVKKGDVDLLYMTTAHEVAHQWWGHQVMEAEVQGKSMLSESLSEYAALMVMKQHYGEEEILKLVDHSINKYLEGRANESEKEMPLNLVENQQYIHYEKGMMAMYALQDYITEDSLNYALKKYLTEWKERKDRYPTSEDLISYLRRATPDSMKYVISDLFESITLYRNRTLKAASQKLSNDNYKLTLTLSCSKAKSDSAGAETSVAINDWVDIGVYGEDAQGEEVLLYLNKHLINQSDQKIIVEVKGTPTKAGIDPMHKLIDVNLKANVIAVDQI